MTSPASPQSVRMDRKAAVQFLHERHPRVVDPPGETVTMGDLHLEVFWLQGHTSELIDRRSRRGAQRCLETFHRLLLDGDSDVRSALLSSCVIHLAYHPDLAWASELMPPPLAEICREARRRQA